MIEDWHFLRDEHGYNREDAAKRMGIQRKTLDKAIARWKLRNGIPFTQGIPDVRV